MNFVFTASKMMKAGEILEQSREAKKNPALLLAIELGIKSKLLEMKKAERAATQSA